MVGIIVCHLAFLCGSVVHFTTSLHASSRPRRGLFQYNLDQPSPRNYFVHNLVNLHSAAARPDDGAFFIQSRRNLHPVMVLDRHPDGGVDSILLLFKF